MAMATDIFGMNRKALSESYDGIETINLEQELADVESLEEGVDPLEFMIGVAYECELDMQRIDMSIIGEEYEYLRENGQEMVYEATSANNIITKFKDWIEKLWRKIQSFFKSVLAKFSDKWLSDEKFAKKYKSKSHDDTAKVAAYDPDALDDLCVGLWNILDNAEKAINGIGDMEDSSDYEDELKKARRTFLDYNEGDTIGKDNDDMDDLSLAKIARHFKVELSSTAKVIDGKFKDAIDILEGMKDARKDIDKSYQANKKMIAAAKKAAKMMESGARRFKVLPTEESHKIHYRVKVINKIGSWNSKINKYSVQVLNMMSTAARTIVIACIKGPKDEKKFEKKWK